MEQESLDLTKTYLQLADDGAVKPIENTPDFWESLAAGGVSLDGRLVTAFHVTEDMPGWEMHPAGDEVLVAISGAIDVILDLPDGYRRIALVNCRVGIVPKGIWHRFEVREPGMLVFITAGNGTQHRSQ